MATTCDTQKKIVDDILNQNKIKKRYVEKELLKWGYVTQDVLGRIENYLGEKYGTDVNSKEFKESLDKVFGPKEGREKMAIRIKALLEGNEIYWEWTKEYILTNLTAEKKLKFKNGQIALNELQQSTLNQIFRTLAAWSEAGTGEKLGVGFLGKIRVQLGLPQTTSRKERTGAFYVFQRAARGYHQELSLRINDFMKKPLTRKSKLKYGWLDIGEKVESLAWSVDYHKDGIELARRKMMRIFIWSQAGDAFNNTIIKWDEKLGDYVIATSYNATDKTYKGTDDAIHGYFDYVPLKDYEGGKYYLNVKDYPSVMKELTKQGERFRALDDELFEYQNKEFQNSVDNIRAAFKSVFNLSGETLDYALFGMIPKKIFNLSKSKRKEALKKVDEQIAAKLGPEKVALLERIKETVSGLAVVNPYWSELNFEKKRNHFPAVYNQFKLPILYDKQISQYKEAIREREEALEVLKRNPGNILDASKKRKEYKEEIKAFRSRILRNQRLLDSMDEMGMDTVADMEQIPFVQNQKYAKRMTNSINPMNMRTDMHAYYSSLKTIMSSIERNNLITIMIEQLGRAESQSVENMIINMFKVPFGFTDVESGLGPISFKTDDITRLVNKMGLSMPAPVVGEYMRMLGSFFSAQMLHGWGTSVQNITAVQQNIVDYGWKSFSEAWSIAKSKGKEGEQWKDLIARSGVTEFRDFFSKSLTASIINDQIELDVHNEINGAFIRYYLLKQKGGVLGKWKGKTAQEADNILRKEIESILSKSEAFVEWENYIPEEGRAFNRKHIYKRKRRKMVIQRYVDWAISKEFEFSPVIKKLSLKHPGQAFGKLIKKTGGGLFKVTSDLIASSPFNMSAGEELIRTVSFIIGVKRAQHHGLIQKGNPDDWTAQDYQQAMEIGRLYSHNSNFGLTPQDVGSLWWSEGGNLMGKFKIWSVQKWSKDFNIMRKGWESLMTSGEMLDLVDGKDKKVARWAKMLVRFNKSLGKRKLRETNPEFAQMRTFLALQGITTLLMDVFVFGPFGGSALGIVLRRFGLQSVAGMRSDLLGLLLLPLTLTLRSLIDDDDDDETRWISQHLLRHSFMGYLPSKMIDWTWNAADAILKADDESVNKVIQGSVDPIVPLRSLTGAPVEYFLGGQRPF